MTAVYKVRAKKQQEWSGIAQSIEHAMELARDAFLCPQSAIIGVSIVKRIK